MMLPSWQFDACRAFSGRRAGLELRFSSCMKDALVGYVNRMTTDGRPQNPMSPRARKAVERAPAYPPLYSEGSAAEEADGARENEKMREGHPHTEAEELAAERIAESQESAT